MRARPLQNLYNTPMRTSASLFSLLIFVFALITSGCETTDRALTAAERVVRSRTGQTVIDLAEGKDPAQIAKKRFDQYARDPEALLRDLRAAKKDFETILAALGVNVGKTWGKKEVQLPERKKYVKYTQNYKSRAIVDFDSGEILVETLDDQDPQRSLKNAVITTILTPEDPRAVVSSSISRINQCARRQKPSRLRPISSKRNPARGWSTRTEPRRRPTTSR